MRVHGGNPHAMLRRASGRGFLSCKGVWSSVWQRSLAPNFWYSYKGFFISALFSLSLILCVMNFSDFCSPLYHDGSTVWDLSDSFLYGNKVSIVIIMVEIASCIIATAWVVLATRYNFIQLSRTRGTRWTRRSQQRIWFKMSTLRRCLFTFHSTICITFFCYHLGTPTTHVCLMQIGRSVGQLELQFIQLAENLPKILRSSTKQHSHLPPNQTIRNILRRLCLELDISSISGGARS